MNSDFSKAISEQIKAAYSNKCPLHIRGGGTKDFYGNAPRGEPLDTREHAGVIDYEPTELVVTARCGTLLTDLEKILAERGQFLPFEPPHFGSGATLGGCVATGLSGPRRASAGAVRDFILGAKVLDGRGRLLAFGGQVMKNVAGYDVSRLLAGSLGTLGVIVEVSLKVLPRPSAEMTLKFELPQSKALENLNRWAGKPLPISASTWCDGELRLRLSGAETAIREAAQKLGGERSTAEESAPFWSGIREQVDPFFTGDAPLWRLSLPPQAAPLELPGASKELPGAQLLEWGGALRWLRGGTGEQLRAAAARAGGHATLFRGGDRSQGAFAPLPPLLARLHRGLKQAFDPAGILNPGRLYAEF